MEIKVTFNFREIEAILIEKAQSAIGEKDLSMIPAGNVVDWGYSTPNKATITLSSD